MAKVRRISRPPTAEELKVTAFEEVDRPILGARSRNLLTEEQVKKLLETAKTNRALSLKLSNTEHFHSLRLSLAYLTKQKGLTFHSRIQGDRLLVWADKAEK